MIANKILYDIIIEITNRIFVKDLKKQSKLIIEIEANARKIPAIDLKKNGYKLRLRLYFKLIQWNLPLYIKLRSWKNGELYT